MTFDLNLLSCRALHGLRHHLQSSFQSDSRMRGEMIMFQVLWVFSSILPSRDFPQYVIWLRSLSAKQIFEGWRKGAQSSFLKGLLFLSWEWPSRDRSFINHHCLLRTCTVVQSDSLLSWDEGLAGLQGLKWQFDVSFYFLQFNRGESWHSVECLVKCRRLTAMWKWVCSNNRRGFFLVHRMLLTSYKPWIVKQLAPLFLRSSY